MVRIGAAMVVAIAALGLPGIASSQSFPEPLAEEALGVSITLPAKYPSSWVLVNDLNFNAILDSRVTVVDTSSPERPLRGIVRSAQFGGSLISSTKGEIYTAETFLSRLTRGERTDAITIWDTATLQPKGEIILPGGKRQQSVTYKNTFQFTNNQQWALVSNFTPAQSVTVVDLDNRKVLGEIDTSGCAHIYPTGQRGFTTFCADGSMTSVELDETGGVKSTKTIAKVQDIDNQPMFSMPAMVGTTAWFVTYYGQLKAFDFSGTVGKALPGKFSLGAADGADPEWRPGGWQVIASDAAGRLYVIMDPHGQEGSHKSGGTEVWVYDTAKKARVARFPLKGVSLAIDVTREDTPHLIVARADGVIDVYNAADGSFVHSLGATVAFNPMVLTAVER
ncbi:MAG: amine dehydrogenase large subunit [Sphingobium sp.]